jgi:hypothetical protein
VAVEALRHLIAQASVEHPCSQGHDWRSIGARPCFDEANAERCSGSRPVYECSRCGDCDYGDEIGVADCQRDCRLNPHPRKAP